MTFAIRLDAPDSATVAADGYSLELTRHCVDELADACRSLLHALADGSTAATDAQLRAQLPGIAPTARLHAWTFPCFMTWMPVLVFATDGQLTAIYTRTLSEQQGMPLVVLEERDREQPVLVPTTEVVREATSFLAAYGHPLA